MRVPYVVGRWVRGNNHYGRQPLIEHLLNIEDNAVWVVGTRRIGKTSLLRQIEYLTDGHVSYVPLFWDLQGCETAAHLSEELFYAIEDAFHRFEPFGVEMADFTDRDAIGIFRSLNRTLAAHDRRLLLLIDETEALINVNIHDGAWLARLRKAFQHSDQRTIATATILLSKLNDANSSWTTSPFLFGFRLANLWSLSPDSAIDLVRQVQADAPIAVDEETIQDILRFTNGHPYLIQYLCQLIFSSEDDLSGQLRPVLESDLVPDQMLTGFFHIDFQHLSQLERQLLLLIAQESVATEETLVGLVNEQPANRVKSFLREMEKMGHVRRIGRHWTVGNEFQRRWLLAHLDELPSEAPSLVSDAHIEEMANDSVHQEADYLQQEIGRLQQTARSLDARHEHEPDARTQRALQQRTDEVNRRLHTLERDLIELTRRSG